MDYAILWFLFEHEFITFELANIFLEIKIFSLCGKTWFIYPVRTSVFMNLEYMYNALDMRPCFYAETNSVT